MMSRLMLNLHSTAAEYNTPNCTSTTQPSNIDNTTMMFTSRIFLPTWQREQESGASDLEAVEEVPEEIELVHVRTPPQTATSEVIQELPVGSNV